MTQPTDDDAWRKAYNGAIGMPEKISIIVAEKISIIVSELATLRAENERLTNIVTGVRDNIPMEYLRQEDVPGATGPTDRLDIVAAMRWYAKDRWKLIDRLKAAERNTAEPVATIRFDRATPGNENEMPKVISCNWQPDGEYQVYLHPLHTDGSRSGGMPPGTNAGAVEVTQADRDATAKVLGYQCWADATDYRLTGEQDRQVEKFVNAFARHRTEAEARGRREALEKTDEEWLDIAIQVHNAVYAGDRGDLLLKRIMTEEK